MPREVIPATMTFLYQFLVGLAWVWEKLLRPFWRWLIQYPSVWLFRKYRDKIWERFVYLPTGHFSKSRAGIVSLSTIAGMYFLVAFGIGLVVDTLLFAFTARTEQVVLYDKQEIYPDDDIHAVTGCRQRPCSSNPNDDNAVYYRVRPHLFHHIWTSLYYGSPGFFYPDEVAAVVRPGNESVCTVFNYGFRQKFARRYWDWYPDALEIRCE